MISPGAAIFSATMPTPEAFGVPPGRFEVIPIPLLLCHGTKDRIVPLQRRHHEPIGATDVEGLRAALSVPETAAYFC